MLSSQGSTSKIFEAVANSSSLLPRAGSEAITGLWSHRLAIASCHEERNVGRELPGRLACLRQRPVDGVLPTVAVRGSSALLSPPKMILSVSHAASSKV